MPSTLTAKAYRDLLRENIAWLKEQPDTLEKKHIISLLEFEIENLCIFNGRQNAREELPEPPPHCYDVLHGLSDEARKKIYEFAMLRSDEILSGKD